MEEELKDLQAKHAQLMQTMAHKDQMVVRLKEETKVIITGMRQREDAAVQVRVVSWTPHCCEFLWVVQAKLAAEQQLRQLHESSADERCAALAAQLEEQQRTSEQLQRQLESRPSGEGQPTSTEPERYSTDSLPASMPWNV